MRRSLLFGLGAVLALSTPLSAQSLFGSAGLGVPLEPLDARARALGAIGPGLLGSTLTPNDPSSAAGLVLPTLTATMQPLWGSFEESGVEGDLQGTRFPLVLAAYPMGVFGNVTASYQGVFDQRWAAERSSLIDVGGEQVRANDRFESLGGAALFQVGWARALGERAGVGISVGRYTGRLDRLFSRTLDTLSVGADVSTFTEASSWNYTGTAGSVGVHVDPNPLIRVGASVHWSGSLEADPKERTEAAGSTFDLPIEYRVGASGALTQRLMFTAGLRYADWSGADGDLTDVETVGSTLSFGAGMEWGGPRFLGRTIPIRLGYRRSALPYRYRAGDPRESALAAGLALNFSQVQEFTLAGIDLALERTHRWDDVLSERFWRMTASLRVSGR